uniref:Abc-1-like kinase n=1 Tax=Tetraselmis sp. GSL018 TaxID=582737 RepID=A0A061RFL6_9CHLO|eukprot:CAMPEP_0177596432 /NCGR_PEP_ID=MMETSP0419_2-20121207/11059_1 /TAXON_ID=582737 /ORGANISM="Tetraselmis sp., Strain GSL018" /LENGTH=841 /DNA_ID=CAMNT_0019088303 /DNA_START=118 /DNA_END=2643 /DNA_ORIENTATION=-
MSSPLVNVAIRPRASAAPPRVRPAAKRRAAPPQPGFGGWRAPLCRRAVPRQPSKPSTSTEILTDEGWVDAKPNGSPPGDGATHLNGAPAAAAAVAATTNGTNGTNGSNGSNGAVATNGSGPVEATLYFAGNGSEAAALREEEEEMRRQEAAAAKKQRQSNGASELPAALRTGDDLMAPQDAGQLELAAATVPAAAKERAPPSADKPKGAPAGPAKAEEAKVAKAEEEKAAPAAAKSPYENPGGRWNQFKSYGVIQRTLQIWTFAIKFAFRYFLLGKKFTFGKEGMTPAAVSARKTELAVWLREQLVRLGPTFIKIGQQFSTRVDVLAPEFVKELEKLQDSVPPFDWDTARRTVEESLGATIEETFDSFDPEPIAAASLGQVHLAEIGGKKVVVKIQRPGLRELFEIDCKNIRVLAQWLQRVDPKTDGAARDWVAIYDECQRILFEEIDYTKEGANAQRFKENFKDIPWVRVPEVLWDYSSPKVLTLEFVPGIKINRRDELKAAGMDLNQLARWNVESYLLQILKFGFFHADPHPGNVAVDTSHPGGRLIYYDFGMMGSLGGDVRGGLVELFYGIYGRDVERSLQALIMMGILVPGGDPTSLKRTAKFFINSFADRLKSQQAERQKLGSEYDKAYKEQRSKDEQKERRKQILTNIGEDLLLAGQDQPFRFPAAFTFVIRSFTVLDGIGKSLTPKFDISEISAPYARSLLLEDNPILQRLRADFLKRAKNQNRAVVNLFKGPNQIEYVSDTMMRMENGQLKIRVRALEAERALTRLEAGQKVLSSGLVASMMVNVGTVLSVSAMSTAATAAFSFAGVMGLVTVLSYLKVAKLNKQELKLKGQV